MQIGIRAIKAAVHIPVVAIGGINAANATPVMATGVDGVAVVSTIMAQTDIRDAVQGLLSLLKGTMR